MSVSANLDWGDSRSSATFLQTQVRFVPSAGPLVRAAPLTSSVGNALSQALGGIGVMPLLPPFTVVQVPVSVERRFIGAEDPAFALTWRVVGEDRAPVDVDLSASYAPDIFQARSAGAERTGTRAEGGQRAMLQAAVSREMRRLTVRAYGTFGYDGRRDTGGTDEVIRSGARADYAAGVQTELRLLPFLALNSGASVSRAVRFDAIDISTVQGTTYRSSDTVRPPTNIDPYAGLVFPLLGRRAVGEFLYQRGVTSDEKTDFGRYTHQGSNVFSASVRFVLG